jgi:hypothetical protein
VVKKFKIFASMTFKGKVVRNKILADILPSLWFGNVDGEIHL